MENEPCPKPAMTVSSTTLDHLHVAGVYTCPLRPDDEEAAPEPVGSVTEVSGNQRSRSTCTDYRVQGTPQHVAIPGAIPSKT